ncbi:hypothetical protein [Paenibacillus sp. LHD-38]|uniref:hypothetical protein n=1 Tax=Paenibacillus sp. LHD-38 TaxID=3072143 RepID=UPI00280E7A90|nr:hypothetical protein [Paenibacillus sp. LHD-38]MDQ8739159.1 hypothetical protein [Paenibacillus sp. LHD-38]
MSRRFGLYIILAILLFSISTVVNAASNQTNSSSLTDKQKEEIKALVDKEFQSQKDQLKKELLEELGRNQYQYYRKDSPPLDAHDPQIKLLK